MAPGVAAQHLSELSAEVRMVRMERDRLRSELTSIVNQRDELARTLAMAESLKARADERLRETTGEEDGIGADEPSFEDLSDVIDPTALLAQLGEPEGTAIAVIERAEPEPAASASIEPAATRATMSTRVAATASGVYVVKRGDTMWRIAQMHGMTLETLMAVNGLTDPNQVRAGQTLRVGAASPTADAAAGADGRWYVVQAGDSLYGIGKRFESSVADLLRWNDLAEAEELRVGQRLRLFETGGL
jgi:membrane-bound lytic murein transglycosylase D